LSKALKIFVDGACHGNPGPAGIGVAIFENEKLIKEISKPIGDATNNIAEYSALIFGLLEAQSLKAEKLTILSDSQLVCRQVEGTYKIKNIHLKFLHEQILFLLKMFKAVEIRHIPREENELADKLAAGSLKIRKGSQDDRPEEFLFGEESPSSKG
jgi:ribonuclease HI